LALVGALVLAGCGGATSTPDDLHNPLNHVHDLLALRGMPNTVLLATHLGLYRTSDGGAHWKEVGGGAGQAMDGLMLFKLSQSPVDPMRIYLLAIPRTGRPQDAKATTGIYTSADGGKTWQLAAPVSAFPTGTVFTIGAGSASAGQVFAVVTTLANKGLFASDDFGKTWRQLPQVPDSTITGVTGDSNHPGRMILWSYSTGLYRSDDQGQSWQQAAGTQNGVLAVAIAGTTIYASGQDGAFVSTDDGATYTLMNKQYTFGYIAASAATPTTAYALIGSALYRTADSGKTWTATAPPTAHPGNVTVDPNNANTVYVSFSYPVGVQGSTSGGAHWSALLP
jgi:photosystem II stability/assembly factor-like uncharacterized protein